MFVRHWIRIPLPAAVGSVLVLGLASTELPAVGGAGCPPVANAVAEGETAMGFANPAADLESTAPMVYQKAIWFNTYNRLRGALREGLEGDGIAEILHYAPNTAGTISRSTSVRDPEIQKNAFGLEGAQVSRENAVKAADFEYLKMVETANLQKSRRDHEAELAAQGIKVPPEDQAFRLEPGFLELFHRDQKIFGLGKTGYIGASESDVHYAYKFANNIDSDSSYVILHAHSVGTSQPGLSLEYGKIGINLMYGVEFLLPTSGFKSFVNSLKDGLDPRFAVEIDYIEFVGSHFHDVPNANEIANRELRAGNKHSSDAGYFDGVLVPPKPVVNPHYFMQSTMPESTPIRTTPYRRVIERVRALFNSGFKLFLHEVGNQQAAFDVSNAAWGDNPNPHVLKANNLHGMQFSASTYSFFQNVARFVVREIPLRILKHEMNVFDSISSHDSYKRDPIYFLGYTTGSQTTGEIGNGSTWGAIQQYGVVGRVMEFHLRGFAAFIPRQAELFGVAAMSLLEAWHGMKPRWGMGQVRSFVERLLDGLPPDVEFDMLAFKDNPGVEIAVAAELVDKLRVTMSYVDAQGQVAAYSQDLYAKKILDIYDHSSKNNTAFPVPAAPATLGNDHVVAVWMATSDFRDGGAVDLVKIDLAVRSYTVRGFAVLVTPERDAHLLAFALKTATKGKVTFHF